MRNNSYFQIMKLSVLVVLLLSFVSTVKAQTFVCTDVSFYDTNMTDREIKKIKTDALGSTWFLEFYDNSLKVTISIKGDESPQLIFDKINDSKYQMQDNRRGRHIQNVIELQKWIAYIKSFTIYSYENGKLQQKMTCKRK